MFFYIKDRNLKTFLKKIPYISPVLIRSNRYFYKQYANYKKYQRQRKLHKYGKEALENIKIAFEEMQVPWFLVYGTLLGACREKKFIAHDDDIDIGLFLDDYSEKISAALERYGFVKKYEFYVDDGKYAREETYLYKDLNIDIFYFKLKKGSLIGHGFSNKEGMSWEETYNTHQGLMVQEYSFPYEGLASIKFLESEYLVPSNFKEHLITHYGKECMSKNKNWKFQDSHNIVYLTNKLAKWIKVKS